MSGVGGAGAVMMRSGDRPPRAHSWSDVVDQLRRRRESIRVRATIMATEFEGEPRQRLDAALGWLDPSGDSAARMRRQQAELAAQAWIGEVMVASEHRLPETFLRSLAGSLWPTAKRTDVGRSTDAESAAHATRPAPHRGRFTVRRDPPDWMDAWAFGLPLIGGSDAGDLSRYVSGHSTPIGWPLPRRGALASISSHTIAPRPVPRMLSVDPLIPATIVGRSVDGAPVALPIEHRTRHVVVTGTPGSGKSTWLHRMALDDLRAARPFLFVDPHGTTADDLLDHAHHLGRDVVIIDPNDPVSMRVRALPAWSPEGQLQPQSRLRAQLRPGAETRAMIDQSIRRLADAIASSLADPQWAGPRWFTTFHAVMELVVAHGGELADGAVWLHDLEELRRRSRIGGLSAHTQSVLGNLLRPSNEGPDLRNWVASKLQPLVGDTVRRVLAPAGEGVDIGGCLVEGRTVIVNLASLSTTEANLIGHLVIGSAFDSALDRPLGARDLISCYVDEAHRFPARGLGRVAAEGRKMGLGMMLATQTLSQLPDELADLALSAGTTVAFRSTPQTARRLAPGFGIEPNELGSLPDLAAVVSVQGHGITTVQLEPYELCAITRPISARPTVHAPMEATGTALAEVGAHPGAVARTVVASFSEIDTARDIEGFDQWLARNRHRYWFLRDDSLRDDEPVA